MSRDFSDFFASAGAGGGSALNAFISLYSGNKPLFTADKAQYLRTGYYSEDTEGYPDAETGNYLVNLNAMEALASSYNAVSNVHFSATYNRYYLATITGGNNLTISRYDAETWQKNTSSHSVSSVSLTRIVEKNGTIILTVGSALYRSTDGVTFSEASPPGVCVDLHYSARLGLFIAILNNSQIYTSTNGTSWTARQSSSLSASQFGSITESGALLLATANAATRVYYTSTDGLTWTQRLMPVSQLHCAAYSPTLNLFCLVAGTQTFYSTNGIDWLAGENLLNNYINRISWDPATEKFYSSIFMNDIHYTISSSDGKVWSVEHRNASIITPTFNSTLDTVVAVVRLGAQLALCQMEPVRNVIGVPHQINDADIRMVYYKRVK